MIALSGFTSLPQQGPTRGQDSPWLSGLSLETSHTCIGGLCKTLQGYEPGEVDSNLIEVVFSEGEGQFSIIHEGGVGHFVSGTN